MSFIHLKNKYLSFNLIFIILNQQFIQFKQKYFIVTILFYFVKFTDYHGPPL